MDISFNAIDNSLTSDQFARVSQILYRACGISLGPGKEELVKARLVKRLRFLNLHNFDQYIEFVNSGKSAQELKIMTDALTTNKTSFFREEQHFHFLKDHVIDVVAKTTQKLRIWSAGCSSGEEPYSIAMHLQENISNSYSWDNKILATDISPTVLNKAKNGIYTEESLRDVPVSLHSKYFRRMGTEFDIQYQVMDNIRNMIKFAILNLIGPWPMSGPFDVIFCRNVMIYFDKPTRQKLVSRYYSLLKPGGYLFVGHSESLTGTATQFKYIQPAVYMKEQI
ncbi:protein-glutamate O-methyltransferase [candidate division KSB1 bacterium]|nr:protein-glutamate O-methyltransferase [candidate division KSB1 bacterium]